MNVAIKNLTFEVALKLLGKSYLMFNRNVIF